MNDGRKEMKMRMMVAVLTAVVVGVCGCWSPLVVGEPLMDKDETIYGVHIQPLVGFSKHKVVGVNVAARLEPDISGDRKPNASEIVGLAVGAVRHEVWGDVCGVQIGGYSADASRHVVNGVQIGGFGTIAGEANGVQIAAVGTAFIAVVALAQHHDALTKDTTCSVVLAHKGLKENIHTHIVRSFCDTRQFASKCSCR